MRKTIKQRVGRVAALLMAAALGFGAAMAQTPRISSYYPAAKTVEPYQSLGTKAYIFLPTTFKATQAKAQVFQNDAYVSTLTYTSADGGYDSKLNLNFESTDNILALAKLQQGNIKLNFYELTYLSGGSEVTYSDPENPFGTANYVYYSQTSKLINETGLESGKIKSYYEPDAQEGVMTFTFNKPLEGDNIHATFEYGYGDMRGLTDLPMTLSDDHLTITIDLRGKLYNPSVLAPGASFRDEFGEPLPPPSVITMEITNLVCMDGSLVQYDIARPTDGKIYTLSGRVFKSFDYEDLTFPNPEISAVKFCDSAAPTALNDKLVDGCDTMVITIDNYDTVVSGDVVITVGEVVETIPFGSYTRNDNVITLTIPQSIRPLGSDQMVVSIENVTYNRYDGVDDHYVIPYDFANRPVVTNNLSEVLALEEGSKFTLKSEAGLRVTFSSDFGYMFIEDEIAGVQVYPEDDDAYLSQSTKLVGKIVGRYQGAGMIQILREESYYTEGYANVEIGELFEDDITPLFESDAYNNRLVTITFGENLTAEDGESYILIGEMLPAIYDFVDNFEMPETFVNITGILYNDPSMGLPMLIIRSAEDINKDVSPFTPIAELRQMDTFTTFEVSVKDCVVTYSKPEIGFSVIEDKSGAIQVYTEEGEALPMGYKLSGTLKGSTYYGALVINPADCELEVEKKDVTFGTMMSLEEVASPNNTYRLVTFKNTPETPIVVDGFGIYVGDNVLVCDVMDVLGEDYDAFPENIETVTGVIIPLNINILNEDDGLFEPEPNNFIYVALRSMDDIIVGKSSGDVNGDGEINVSDVTNVVDEILGGQSEVADVNNDGSVNVLDITALVDLLLNAE